jgi:hypothetical protein
MPHKRCNKTKLWQISLFDLSSVLRLSQCIERDCRMRFLRFFWLEWIYLGLNRNRFWFFSFKEIHTIFDSQFLYWFILYPTSTSLREGLTTESAVLQFSFLWVSSPLRNAAKDVNTSWRFIVSPGIISIESPRRFGIKCTKT